MTALRDLTGLPFTRLIVLERASNGRDGSTQWLCECICGKRVPIRAAALINGYAKSCGCLRLECNRQRFVTHGLSDSPEYYIWCTMKDRCLNPKNKSYHNYGGRGITIDPRWVDSFQAFYASMGPRPGPKYSIERTRNELGYSPENCVWATHQVQARNTRSNHMITLEGRTACLTEWLQIKGIARTTFRRRTKAGLSDEQALTMPVRLMHPKRNLIGVSHTTFYRRLRRGMSEEEAMATPPGPRGVKKVR